MKLCHSAVSRWFQSLLSVRTEGELNYKEVGHFRAQ